MAKLTKKQKALQGKVDSNKLYPFAEAVVLVKDAATAKFDESIDVAVQLGVDAKKSDQVVRGAVVLPHGTGKTTRVAVFAQGAKAEEAKAAGADIVGMDDLAAEPQGGHGDSGRGYCREEREGWSGAVPCRQGRDHSQHHRPSFFR